MVCIACASCTAEQWARTCSAGMELAEYRHLPGSLSHTQERHPRASQQNHTQNKANPSLHSTRLAMARVRRWLLLVVLAVAHSAFEKSKQCSTPRCHGGGLSWPCRASGLRPRASQASQASGQKRGASLLMAPLPLRLFDPFCICLQE